MICTQNLSRNSERKILFGRHKRRCEGNTNISLRELGCENVDWSHPTQDTDQRLFPVNAVINIQGQ
jgi:hypothetical protein